MSHSPGVLVALDYARLDDAMALAELVSEHVTGFKVGLELLMGPDLDVIERIGRLGLPVFADAKLHDIPATVEAAAFQLARRGARWVTVHASGGPEMLDAAVRGLEKGNAERGSEDPCGALGVTVLTSLADDDIPSLGMRGTVEEQVERLIETTGGRGLEGFVCAVSEARLVKRLSPDLLAVTPGIRPSGVGSDDQKRVATVEQAVRAGSDLLVVGRAVTSSEDPKSMAARIRGEIGAVGEV